MRASCAGQGHASTSALRALGLAVVFALSLYPASTHCAQIAPSEPVASLVQETADGMSRIINETESAFSRQAFDSRSNAIVVLQQAKFLGDQLIGKTFGDLTVQSQRRFFLDSRALLEQWNSGNRAIAGDLAAVAGTLEDAIARVPTADRRPFVKSYSPSYISSAMAADGFEVSVAGSLLGAGSPSLVFGDKPCSLFAKTERLLRFRCSKAALGKGERLQAVSGRLTVFQEKTLVEVFSGRGAQSTEYLIGLMRVPRLLARTDVTAFVETSEVTTQSRTHYFNYTNAHCTGTREYVDTITPSSGYSIVESSVTVGEPGLSVASSCTGPTPRNVTSSGFQVYGRAVNSGDCIRVLGKTIAKDGRGWVKGTVYWQETKAVPKIEPRDVATFDVLWGTDRAVQLPKDTKGFRIRMDLFDGSTREIDGREENDWFSVDHNEVTRQLTIRPKPLQNALATGG